MEPEQTKPISEKPPIPAEKETPDTTVHRRSHTYEDDVAKAMNATDASVVQELLQTAREREVTEKEYKKSIWQRKWYSIFSILFVVAAIAGFVYAIYHYYTLTVPVEQQYSVGVFPTTTPVVVGETDIRKAIEGIRADTTLKKNEPYLVPLVEDATTLVPVSKEKFFSFIEGIPSEPFAATIDVVRLGALHDGIATHPFIILSIADPEVASKEFLIAESTLLQLFYKALGLDISSYVSEIGKGFESEYTVNLPVRILRTTSEVASEEKPIILYAYITHNIILVTTEISVLSSVYDTIIRQ